MIIYGPFEPDLVHTSGGKWRHLLFTILNARPLPNAFRGWLFSGLLAIH